MSNYPVLRKIKYADREGYEREYEKRHDGLSTIITELKISPFLRDHLDTEAKYNLFYLPIPKIEFLKDELYGNSKQIEELMSSLPKSAQHKVFTSNLIEEIQASNDIEGVESTQKKIAEGMKQIASNPGSKRRFMGLIKLYALFHEKEYSTIADIEDIREIYDQLLENEIDENRKPDGSIFRKEGVEVSNGSKTVHVGIRGEKQIEEEMRRLVKFMNAHDVPSLEKCFVAHYYYEYIHPFYDGNGRTGRFIACSYLSRKLGYLSAISFSSAIVRNKSGYNHSFQEVNHRDNRGEITHFILDMLRFVNDGQQHIIQELTDSKVVYELSRSIIRKKSFSNLEKTVLDLLIQQRLFGNPAQEFTDQELLSEANRKPDHKKISRAKLNQATQSLVEKNNIRQIKRKPSVHILTEEFVEMIYRWSEARLDDTL